MKLKYLIIASFISLIYSCENKEDDIVFENNKIQFKEVDANNEFEVTYSFGEEPLEENEIILNIPVEIIGKTSSKDRRFIVSIMKSKNTKEETFEALEDSYTVLADSITSVIPIKIYRNKIIGSEALEIKLEINESDDFEKGIYEAQTFTINYDNSLGEPYWWTMPNMQEYLGAFQPEKYQKFLELFNSPITWIDIDNNRLGVLKKFKKVKEFFEANPQYNVSFPNVSWPV